MSPLPAGASWSDAAQALFRASGAIAVSAAAGAGKTSALVELLRRRLAGDGPEEPLAPRDVVAITFTERAGAELADRLGRELADGARTLRSAGDGDGAARLEEALRELPSMAVGTIHGWAASVLREHALEAGLDPDFAVLDEEGASELLGAASLEGAVAALDRGGEAERRLATALGGVRALGAEAIALLRERATRGLVGPPEAVQGSDRDVEAAREDVLAAAADLAGMAAAATTPTGQAALGALAARLAELTGAGRLPDGARLASATKGWRTGKRDPPALSAARARFEEAAARLPRVEAEREAAPLALALASLVGDVERRYREAKDRAGVLDFDDLLLRVRDLLRDAPVLRSEMRARARALLVDEYQDVNGLQAEIFELLAGEDAPGPAGTPLPLRVAVGDAKQSIYRFRGADVGVFAGLIGRLAAGQGQVVHLRENHRSTGGIVDLVNALLSGEEGGLGVPFGDEDRLRATRPGGDRPAAELLEDGEGGSAEERRAREARAVAARIAELLAAGTPPGDVAILFRRLTHVGVFERALREAGIPVRVARGGGFFQAPEVRDLGELCAVVEEPGDEVAWAALLRSPLCSLSDATLFALARRGLARLSRIDPAEAGAEIGLARSGEAPPGEGDRLRRLLETWRELREGRGRLDAGETISLAVERLDVEAALLAGPDGERRAANVRKVVEIARRQAARGVPVGTFADRLRTLSRLPPREPEADGGDADAVSLLTVHQAKGLEWPVVLVPELGARPPTPARRPVLDEQGRVAVPLLGDGGAAPAETDTTARVRAAASRAERAEGRRLLYVALTRARDRLVLSGSTLAHRHRHLGRGRGAGPARVAPPPPRAVRPAPARRADRADRADRSGHDGAARRPRAPPRAGAASPATLGDQPGRVRALPAPALAGRPDEAAGAEERRARRGGGGARHGPGNAGPCAPRRGGPARPAAGPPGAAGRCGHATRRRPGAPGNPSHPRRRGPLPGVAERAAAGRLGPDGCAAPGGPFPAPARRGAGVLPGWGHRRTGRERRRRRGPRLQVRPLPPGGGGPVPAPARGLRAGGVARPRRRARPGHAPLPPRRSAGRRRHPVRGVPPPPGRPDPGPGARGHPRGGQGPLPGRGRARRGPLQAGGMRLRGALLPHARAANGMI